MRRAIATIACLALAQAGWAQEPLRPQMEAQIAKDLISRGAKEGQELKTQVRRELDLRFALEAYARSKGIDKGLEARALTRIAQQEALVRALMESERSAIKISDEQLRSDYKLRFPTQRQVKARLALFKDEAQAKKQWGEVSSGAKSLEQAAKESSDETIAAKGGDLGYVALSALPEELAAPVGALKEGQSLAAPVKTRYGYFIGKAEAWKVAPERDFESVKAELLRQREEIALKERLAKITEQALAKKP